MPTDKTTCIRCGSEVHWVGYPARGWVLEVLGEQAHDSFKICGKRDHELAPEREPVDKTDDAVIAAARAYAKQFDGYDRWDQPGTDGTMTWRDDYLHQASVMLTAALPKVIEQISASIWHRRFLYNDGLATVPDTFQSGMGYAQRIVKAFGQDLYDLDNG